jgi:hypothetical protein
MIDAATIVTADARLVRVPVDPPRGDAIQTFDAFELPIVELTDRSKFTQRNNRLKSAGSSARPLNALCPFDRIVELQPSRVTSRPFVPSIPD